MSTTKKPNKQPEKLLTKAGTERKRAPGAGRPSMGRSAQPPKIRPESLKTLRNIAGYRETSVAGAIELAASMAHDVIMGIDPRRWLESQGTDVSGPRPKA